jgi:large subunit ribosomal protein L6
MKSFLIPTGVTIKWGHEFFQVTGPLGTITKKKGDLSFAIKNNRFYFLDDIIEKKRHFYFSMISNLVLGVSKGYSCKLRLVGVGYRASVSNKVLTLKIGYSHEIKYDIPQDVDIFCGKTKGTRLLIRGIELQRVTQIASEIRSLRIPDVYKGKGIHYHKENIVLKKGKREGK